MGEGKMPGARKKVRSPGIREWSKPRRDVFLETLAATGNVAASAREAKMPEWSARRLRKQDAAFDAAWLLALRDGYERLELLLLQRAIAGSKPREAVAGDDAAAGYSDALAFKLLEAHRKTVGAARMDVPSDPEAARKRLAAKLEQMARRRGDG